MANINVVSIAGKQVGTLELHDSVWSQEVNEHLLWEAVKWQLAKRRAGTHSTKTVAMVKGGNKKPFKQKGTGQARQGSTKAHHHVGGGKAFGPHPRDYEYVMPKKARKSALRSVLSLRLKEQKLVVLDNFEIAEAKTKFVVQALSQLGAGKALIVDSKDNASLMRGAKNLPNVKWIAPEGLNVYDVMKYETLIITSGSAKQVEASLMSGLE